MHRRIILAFLTTEAVAMAPGNAKRVNFKVVFNIISHSLLILSNIIIIGRYFTGKSACAIEYGN